MSAQQPGQKLLFLTGKLAEKPLYRVLRSMDKAPFSWDIRQIGVNVAALMTASLIQRRLRDTANADKVILPGRMRGDIDALSRHFNVPFQRGPDELSDLPRFFDMEQKKPDLSRYHCLIFAEIHDAPALTLKDLMARALYYRTNGADVIDLGCLPDTPFPHMEEAIQALIAEGYKISVDSADSDELRRAVRAGAHYLLSLHEKNIDIMEEGDVCPILIPTRGHSLASLERVIDHCRKRDRAFLADPILEPIHYGFSASLHRYYQLRRRHPDIKIMMGLGNLTELSDCDSVGLVTTMMGVVSELAVDAVLCLQASHHCRRVIGEVDQARRMMYAAHQNQSLPKNISDALICLHDKKNPYHKVEDIKETAAMIRDPNYRVMISDRGVHIFNRDGHHIGDDPFALFPHLGLDGNPSHAFYLGVETARAQIAFQLGKRYVQDEELDWKTAVAPKKPEKTGKGDRLQRHNPNKQT